MIDSKLSAFKEKAPEVVAEAEEDAEAARRGEIMTDASTYDESLYDDDDNGVQLQENGGDGDTEMSDEVEGN